MTLDEGFEPICVGKKRLSKDKQLSLDLYKQALKIQNWTDVDKYRDDLIDTGLFGNTYREFIALSAVDVYLTKHCNVCTEDIVKFLKDIEEEK